LSKPTFPTREDAMTALDAEHFQDVKVRTETLGSTIFLFEVAEVRAPEA
jgi:hypothetical protein